MTKALMHASTGDSIRTSTFADRVGGARQLKLLLPVIAILAVAIALAVYYWKELNALDSRTITGAFAVVLSALLSALPPVLCFVQNVSRRRQRSKLDGLKHLPLAETVSYRAALAATDSGRLIVDGDYLLPIIAYFLFTVVGFVAIFMGFSYDKLFQVPTVLLGGLQPHNGLDDPIYAAFQAQTFVVISMAFFGTYVYTIARILDRINNNDLYPISLYYYTARIIIACAVAAVLRHTVNLFGDVESALTTDVGRATLILMGFVVGFAPDLFILTMSRKAFQYLKIWGSRDDPAPKDLPTTLPLLMIDDLTREKIDRLNELGIDSAQVLAWQNPFLLLPRLHYDLGLIVNWIAQAQLYALVKDEGLTKLRKLCVRHILDFALRLADRDSSADISAALGLSAEAGRALAQQLESDPMFLRLRELSAAMKPPADDSPVFVAAMAGTVVVPVASPIVAKKGEAGDDVSRT
jgi:hypothetical protein